MKRSNEEHSYASRETVHRALTGPMEMVSPGARGAGASSGAPFRHVGFFGALGGGRTRQPPAPSRSTMNCAVLPA